GAQQRQRFGVAAFADQQKRSAIARGGGGCRGRRRRLRWRGGGLRDRAERRFKAAPSDADKRKRGGGRSKADAAPAQARARALLGVQFVLRGGARFGEILAFGFALISGGERADAGFARQHQHVF